MRTVLRSDDLTCPSCVRTLEKVLTALDGVDRAWVHVATGRIEIEHDPRQASVDDLLAVVRATGYTARMGAL